ncbi:MAG: hypothetical protein LAT63_17365 [Marinobacter sp.]|nr:hypothetical protein [Marinobacter sp.]
MQQSCKLFVDSLLARSNALSAAYAELNEYWLPDEPPLTSLFAALGDRIAEELGQGKDVDDSIFDLIERAMVSGDEILILAVATGLIEAMVARAGSSDDEWERIVAWLGEASRSHAEAWRGN